MNPDITAVQHALFLGVLENLARGRRVNGRPLLNVAEVMHDAQQALDTAKLTEERYGKNGN